MAVFFSVEKRTFSYYFFPFNLKFENVSLPLDR